MRSGTKMRSLTREVLQILKEVSKEEDRNRKLDQWHNNNAQMVEEEITFNSRDPLQIVRLA